MSAGELLALLRSDISMDDVPQSGCVDDAMLARLLDRSWMLTPEERQQQQQQGEAGSAGSSDAEGSEGSSKGKAAKGKGGRRASCGGAAAAAEAAAAAGSSGQEQQAVAGLPYPASGVGYEVVQAIGDSGLLSNVN
jgi:hypothetical protein